MSKLSDLFEFDAGLLAGLEGIEVKSLVYFEDTKRFLLSLYGLETITPNNNLLGFVNVASKEYESGFDIRFDCSNINDSDIYVKALSQYIIAEIKKCPNPAFTYADMLSFDADKDQLVCIISDSVNCLLDESEIGLIANKFNEIFATITNIKLAGVKHSYSIAPSEQPVYYSEPVDELPVLTMDEDAYYSQVYMPDIPAELIKESNDYAAENQPKDSRGDKKGKKDKKEGGDKADKEDKPKEDSWLGKAMAKQESFKADNQNNGNSFYRVKNIDSLFGRVKGEVPTITCDQLSMNEKMVNVTGAITLTDDLKLSKSGKVVIANFYIVDTTGGISAIMFVNPAEADDFEKKFKKGGYAGFQGEPYFNRGELSLKVSGIFEAKAPKGREDYADVKRVELHVHSKFSEKDAVSSPASIMKLAASFGHKACAITDHGVVQGFPAAYNEVKSINKGREDGDKFKAILGCEGYLVDDGPTVFYNLPYDRSKMMSVGSIVSLAIKTTGKDSCTDTIVSIAASKYRVKGFKGIAPEFEGERDEDAIAFSAKDIDKSLWEPEEIPETLRDDVINAPEPDAEDTVSHIINISNDVSDIFAEDDIEKIPDEIEFEHVADFYAEVEDVIYKGKGEPCESYHRMGELLEFIGQSYVCGPDIFNTLAFLRRAGYGINIEDHVYYRHKFLMPAICVEDLVRYTYENLEDKELSQIVNELNVPCVHEYQNSGDDVKDYLLRDCYDSANIVMNYLVNKGTINPYDLNDEAGHLSIDEVKSRKNRPFHIIFLVRNNLGLYNLYRMISEAHTNYFLGRPRTVKSLIKYYSSSIIIGGACERGEIYREILEMYKATKKNVGATQETIKTSKRLKDILSLYDYIEIQPLCNNMFMTREVNKNNDPEFVSLDANDIRILNELLVFTADYYGLPCAATTDSHFLEKHDGMYRKNLLISLEFPDAETQPDLYFRTTDEMLDEFYYLGEEKAYEVVVKNTNMIADMIEYGIKPFPDGTYPPIIKRAAADVRDIAYTRANKLYRHNGVLNEVVKARLEKELNSIIGNGFGIMYYIAYRLVKKSNNDGYIVGSRGSVGSSFVATMCGISEVNPLAPHYRCPHCKYLEFNNTGEYGSGFDMPVKNCPECGTEMVRDGQDIPFETFLGFYGDKQPDIDLNFASDYQPRAHKYVEVLFGHSYTFRAGTIGGYADKNAIGVARKVGETRGINYSNAMLYYLSKGIIDVKRTTSQHPGGIVVVPKEMDVYEFTPIQYPANKTDCGIITTHFDFRAMHDTILKLDILGHADPNVLRMLQEITGVEVTSIPVPEPKVMSLLEKTDALGFPLEATEAGAATLGLSEMGTHMARGMIKETQPRRFYDLVQLMGLSHGTDVWTGNAQDLIRDGICDLNSVIGCRDSIMTRLIYWGVPNKDAFDIMENVRKGKVAGGAVAEKWAKWKEELREHNVPEWYIGSCEKIKYMFPKAHAAAYSISSLRVAWFKVYYPEEYYCAFFSIRGDEFAASTMCQGEEVLRNRRILLNEQMHIDNNPKTKSEYYLCEIVEEMYHRNIKFLPIDLNTSDATRFKKIDKGLILPPLNVIDGISDSIAEGIVNARNEAPFANREDLMQRGGVGKSALQILVDYGLCKDLPESAQIDIFSLMGGM